MKQFSFLIFILLISVSASYSQDNLDKVSIYHNGKLVGTWRADEAGIVHVDNIAENDTLLFSAQSDVGGLGNSSIDIKDNSGDFVDNIEDPVSNRYAANFIYVVHFKKIDTTKVSTLEFFLNVDPARNIPAPNIASIKLN